MYQKPSKDLEQGKSDIMSLTPLIGDVRLHLDHRELLKEILSRATNVDMRDKDGYTPLHYAVQEGACFHWLQLWTLTEA